ncbi:uncharacterized protein LOC119094504, partial [Pollicipes pollicipes]|uniref:uncharacterized protein LOC119094504 n=1 Tax=Pollicipes pollicipes TaxID=41117 RepID=UPI0018850950
MRAAMVPDVHQTASGVPFGPAASHHAQTLEAVWRHGPAGFYEPAKELAAAACGLWSAKELCGAPGAAGGLYPLRTNVCGKTQASLHPGMSEVCGALSQTSLYPGRTEACGAPGQTSLYSGRSQQARGAAGPPSLYPGRAVPVRPAPPAPLCCAPLRSSRVSSSTDAARDLSQPLFVDTTVEYDLPKEAYPPENSEPLLIVHPQYFEHLRHRRTLGSACVCQLCNFYGRRMPLEACAPPPAAPAVTATAAAVPPAFQRPGVTCDWPRFQQQQQQQQP